MELEIEIGALAEGESRSVRLGYGRYVLVSRLEGRLHAIDDVCNHGGCKLSDGWRGIDVIVEGVSLVQNFRSQTQEILSSESPDALIQDVRAI